MLARISGFAIRRPAAVILVWIVVVAAGFVVGVGVFGRVVSDVGTVPGSESDLGERHLKQAAPAPETITAVFSGRPADDPALRADVAAAIADVRGIPGVASV